MKFTVDGNFWNQSNIFAKICLMIGFWFVNLGMKLNGMEEHDTHKYT